MKYFVPVLALICSVLEVSAQDYEPLDFTELRDVQTWEELCGIIDCDQFPVGYTTYSIGAETYYFPTRRTLNNPPFSVGVRGHIAKIAADGEVLRAFGFGSLKIGYCCQILLEFFKLSEDFPDFRSDRAGNEMPVTRVTLRPSDDPARFNKIQDHTGGSLQDPAPSISTVISANQESYNDDFWILDIWDQELSDAIVVDMLSKERLLNDRHVFTRCTHGCDFHTVSFAEDGENERAHISMQWMTLTGDPLILCTPESFEYGCDPSPDIFDQVPTMLGLIDDLFRAAQASPFSLE